jgi:hypothetical protein
LPYVLNTGTLFQTTVGAPMPVRQRRIPRRAERDKGLWSGDHAGKGSAIMELPGG